VRVPRRDATKATIAIVLFVGSAGDGALADSRPVLSKTELAVGWSAAHLSYDTPLAPSQTASSRLLENTRPAHTILVGGAISGLGPFVSSVAAVARPNANPAASSGTKKTLTAHDLGPSTPLPQGVSLAQGQPGQNRGKLAKWLMPSLLLAE